MLAELYGVRTSDREYSHSHVLPVSRKVATPFTESIRELRTAVQVSLAEAEKVVVVVTAADPHAPAPSSRRTSRRPSRSAVGGRSRSRVTCVDPSSIGCCRRRRVVGRCAHAATHHDPQPRCLPRPRGGDGPGGLPRHDPGEQADRGPERRRRGGRHRRPPVLAAADATILGRYGSGVVLIASAGKTDRAVLAEASERLRINNVPLVGIALAGVKSDRRMLYASTYGDPESSPTTSAAAAHDGQSTNTPSPYPRRWCQRSVRTCGSPPGGRRGRRTARRAARERAAAVATDSPPSSNAEVPSPSAAAPAEEPALDRAPDPAPEAAGAPAAAPVPPQSSARREGTTRRSGQLLSPEWAKISVMSSAPPTIVARRARGRGRPRSIAGRSIGTQAAFPLVSDGAAGARPLRVLVLDHTGQLGG
ncbi:hypothetical protein NKG05_19655 [Oerskovia sp. M15]